MSDRPPSIIRGAAGRQNRSWARLLHSCVSSPLNVILTLVVLTAIVPLSGSFIRWAFVDAQWTGNSGEACLGARGACWAFINARFGQIFYGGYPQELRWRVDIVFALIPLSAAALSIARGVWKRRLGASLVILVPTISVMLLLGGIFGLRAVPSSQWGGLMLTLIAAEATLIGAIVLGLILALGRRSSLPVIRVLSIVFIEFWRGIPLVAILFMVMAVVPLLLPPGTNASPVMRALISLTLFNAAVIAEVFRGGFASVSHGQIEAAQSLGFNKAQQLLLVVLPQVVTTAAPALVSTAVAIVKETTVLLMIGLFDFLGILQAGLADPAWIIGAQVQATVYVFATLVYFTICFGLSRFGSRLSRRSAGLNR